MYYALPLEFVRDYKLGFAARPATLWLVREHEDFAGNKIKSMTAGTLRFVRDSTDLDQQLASALANLVGSCTGIAHFLKSPSRFCEPTNLSVLSLLGAGAGDERRRTFIRGHFAAAEALRQLGIENPPVLGRGIRREPLWPGSVACSISRWGNSSIAVAARDVVRRFDGY